MSIDRPVTEFDLRMPEFQDPRLKLDELERRDDGKIVRKDRWETALRNVAAKLGWSRRDYECDEVPREVERRLRLAEAIESILDDWSITLFDPAENGARQFCVTDGDVSVVVCATPKEDRTLPEIVMFKLAQALVDAGVLVRPAPGDDA